MSGGVIQQARTEHACRPGWRWRESGGEGFGATPKGTVYGIPPTPWEYPKGTVWACDCGRTWVSQGSPGFGMPGFCMWRRELRFERWRRQARAQADGSAVIQAGRRYGS